MPEKDLSHRLTGDSSSLEGAMGRGGRAMSAAAREARRLEIQQQRTGAAMTMVGRGMFIAGAAIAAGLALSVKAAVDWESAWTGVLKTVDGTDVQMAALEDEIRSLTEILPATHAEIAGVAEAAGQLGVAREDVADFTQVMIAMGEATDLTSDQAATALARLMNIMQTAPGDVERLASTIVDLGNKGATTESEITEMALRIAGAARTIGLTEAQVIGFAAALSNVGINAEAGGTAISKVFLEIDAAVSEGGDQLETFAQVAGMSADRFATAYRQDAGAAIAEFVAGLARVQSSGGDVNAILSELGLTEIRVTDALRRLAGSGDNLTQSLKIGSQAWDENTALMAEAERRYGTTESQMRIARNQVNDFAISVGQTLLPVLGEMVGGLGDLATIIGDLPGPVKAALAVVALLAAGILLLGGGLLMVIPRIAATKAALDQMAASGGRAAVAAGLLGRSFGAIAGVLGGPWGIALGVAVTALSIFGVTQAQARGEVRELSETLDQQTGAITDNTRAWIANELESTGVLQAAQRIGVDLATLVSAIEGESAALDVVNTAIDRNVVSRGQQAAQTGDLVRIQNEYKEQLIAQGMSEEEATRRSVAYSESLIGQHAAATIVGDATGVMTGQVNAAQEATQRQAEATGQAKTAMEQLDPATRAVGEALGTTAALATDLTEQVDALDAELKALLDTAFGLTQAEDALTESMRALVEQVEQQVEAGDRGAASLTGNSEAAIGNRRAMEDLIESYAAMITEMIEAGAGTDDVQDKTDGFRAELRRVARQLGINDSELEFYMGLLDDIPGVVRTSINIDTQAAINRIHALNNSINIMIANANRGAHVRVTGGISQANQHGGEIFGPAGIDRVPSMLTAGEIVIRRSVAQQHKQALLALNATGHMPASVQARGATSRMPVGGGPQQAAVAAAGTAAVNQRELARMVAREVGQALDGATLVVDDRGKGRLQAVQANYYTRAG